jgi:hypothetical protein
MECNVIGAFDYLAIRHLYNVFPKSEFRVCSPLWHSVRPLCTFMQQGFISFLQLLVQAGGSEATFLGAGAVW